MYVRPNFKTKKEFKAAVAAGHRVEAFQPGGVFEGVSNGVAYIEGPHYPAAHTWYAEVEVRDGLVVKVRK